MMIPDHERQRFKEAILTELVIHIRKQSQGLKAELVEEMNSLNRERIHCEGQLNQQIERLEANRKTSEDYTRALNRRMNDDNTILDKRILELNQRLRQQKQQRQKQPLFKEEQIKKIKKQLQCVTDEIKSQAKINKDVNKTYCVIQDKIQMLIEEKEERDREFKKVKEIQMKKQQIKSGIKKKGIVNPRSKWIKNYKVKGQDIEKAKDGDSQNDSQLLGRVPIAQKNENKFTIVECDNHSGFIFGIVDQKYLNDEDSRESKREQCIIYNGCDGELQEGGNVLKQDLTELEEGDTIIMKVEPEHQQIVFTVNGKHIVTHMSEQLSNPKINWVPALWVENVGDIVRWE